MNKIILLAIGLTAMSVVPAHAVLIALLLPFHKTSELLVGMVNRCSTPATYRLVIRNAVNGAVLHREEGTIAAMRGAALPWSFGASQSAAMLRVSVKWECPELDAAKPLISFTVRDLDTKVPQFVGGSTDGTGI